MNEGLSTFIQECMSAKYAWPDFQIEHQYFVDDLAQTLDILCNDSYDNPYSYCYIVSA